MVPSKVGLGGMIILMLYSKEKGYDKLRTQELIVFMLIMFGLLLLSVAFLLI